MKFTLNRKELIDALAWMAGTTNARGTLTSIPHLLHIESKGGKVFLERTDYDVWSAVELGDAVADTDTNLITSAGLLLLIAKAMRGDDVHLTVDADGPIKVTGGRANATLPRVSVDLPTPPKVMSTSFGEVDGTEFARALGIATKVAVTSTLTEDRAINIDADGDTLTVHATDRYRVSEISIPYKGSELHAGLFCTATAKMVDATSGPPVQISARDGIFVMIAGPRRLVCRMKDPGPRKAPGQVLAVTGVASEINVADLADLVARCGGLTDLEHNIVLDLADGVMRVSTEQIDDASLTDYVEVDWPHTPMRLTVKPKYLAEALAAQSEDAATLTVSKPNKPLYLVSAGVLSVVMPIWKPQT